MVYRSTKRVKEEINESNARLYKPVYEEADELDMLNESRGRYRYGPSGAIGDVAGYTSEDEVIRQMGETTMYRGQRVQGDRTGDNASSVTDRRRENGRTVLNDEDTQFSINDDQELLELE